MNSWAALSYGCRVILTVLGMLQQCMTDMHHRFYTMNNILGGYKSTSDPLDIRNLCKGKLMTSQGHIIMHG